MKKPIYIILSCSILLLLLYLGCDNPFSKNIYANGKTSEVFIIKQKIKNARVEDSLMLHYSISKIEDSVLLEGVELLKNARFDVDILYFKDENILMGVGSSWYVVRYIYNPKLSDGLLDGFSSVLSEEEKQRLSDKFHTIMKGYR